jgi:hypothetical protein
MLLFARCNSAYIATDNLAASLLAGLVMQLSSGLSCHGAVEMLDAAALRRRD